MVDYTWSTRPSNRLEYLAGSLAISASLRRASFNRSCDKNRQLDTLEIDIRLMNYGTQNHIYLASEQFLQIFNWNVSFSLYWSSEVQVEDTTFTHYFHVWIRAQQFSARMKANHGNKFKFIIKVMMNLNRGGFQWTQKWAFIAHRDHVVSGLQHLQPGLVHHVGSLAVEGVDYTD